MSFLIQKTVNLTRPNVSSDGIKDTTRVNEAQKTDVYIDWQIAMQEIG